MSEVTQAPLELSVIVPLFNAKAYLRTCVESILRSSDLRLEVIIVDDGSTDGSLDVARALCSKDPRVRVLSGPNKGSAHARNRGMDSARGAFIAFIDADDWVDPQMLPRLVSAAANAGADCVSCDLLFAKSDTASWPEQNSLPGGEYSRQRIEKDIFPRLLSGRDLVHDWPYRMVTKVFSQDLIKESGVRFRESLRAAQDYVFSVEIMCHTQNFLYLKGCFWYHYRHNPDSRTHRPLARAWSNYEQVGLAWRSLPDVYDFSEQIALADLHGVLSTLTYHYTGAPNGGLQQFREMKRFISQAPYRAGLQLLDWNSLDEKKRVICLLLKFRLIPLIHLVMGTNAVVQGLLSRMAPKSCVLTNPEN